MTDPAPNSISAELVLTGPTDQILAAKAAILRIPEDYPDVKLSARIETQVSSIEFIGDKSRIEFIGQRPAPEMTIEELIGHPDPGNSQVDRTRNNLRRAQIETVSQLVEKTEDDLLAITHFGQKSLDLVKEKLAEHGLSLKPIG